VATQDRAKYFYPDVFATKEMRTQENEYIKYEPEIIIEVISPLTHITDTVDKYIAYTSIRSLKYYLIVEPETIYVVSARKLIFFKNPWLFFTIDQQGEKKMSCFYPQRSFF